MIPSDEPEVTSLHSPFQRRMADRALASRPVFVRLWNLWTVKATDQIFNYGKALENAGKAVISIARGMKMEEYLSEERLARESARVGEDNANN